MILFATNPLSVQSFPLEAPQWQLQEMQGRNGTGLHAIFYFDLMAMVQIQIGQPVKSYS